jgi:hypothetical protein
MDENPYKAPMEIGSGVQKVAPQEVVSWWPVALLFSWIVGTVIAFWLIELKYFQTP